MTPEECAEVFVGLDRTMEEILTHLPPEERRRRLSLCPDHGVRLTSTLPETGSSLRIDDADSEFRAQSMRDSVECFDRWIR